MRLGLRHIHRRKRHAKPSLAPYPHPNKWMRLLDRIVLCAGIVGPVMTLPQILKIYTMQTAAGISLTTWTLYLFMDIPWLFYGIVHKAKPIIFAYALWIIVNFLVVYGTLLYR